MKTYQITFPVSYLKGTNRQFTVKCKDIQAARERAIDIAHKHGFMFGTVMIRELVKAEAKASV